VPLLNTDEFQRVLLNEIREIKGEIREIKGEIGGIKGEIGGMKGEIGGMKGEINSIKESQSNTDKRLTNIETRQDEIYQVGRAIEHSNLVGKSELDSQNIRLAKVEGKLKRVAKVYNEEIEVDKASNL
jgi:chromosome segregation ATPase